MSRWVPGVCCSGGVQDAGACRCRWRRIPRPRRLLAQDQVDLVGIVWHTDKPNSSVQAQEQTAPGSLNAGRRPGSVFRRPKATVECNNKVAAGVQVARPRWQCRVLPGMPAFASALVLRCRVAGLGCAAIGDGERVVDTADSPLRDVVRGVVSLGPEPCTGRRPRAMRRWAAGRPTRSLACSIWQARGSPAAQSPAI
eukprot:1646312-Rhodomonas_salina.2